MKNIDLNFIQILRLEDDMSFKVKLKVQENLN
jgi:hypothetical protein